MELTYFNLSLGQSSDCSGFLNHFFVHGPGSNHAFPVKIVSNLPLVIRDAISFRHFAVPTVLKTNCFERSIILSKVLDSFLNEATELLQKRAFFLTSDFIGCYRPYVTIDLCSSCLNGSDDRFSWVIPMFSIEELWVLPCEKM